MKNRENTHLNRKHDNVKKLYQRKLCVWLTRQIGFFKMNEYFGIAFKIRIRTVFSYVAFPDLVHQTFNQP